MIPKIIHYCWYGRGKKDALTKKCIASWKKYCPDYQIIEWNEDNCDIESSVWAREAYRNKKWAFVSDYFRLKIMYEYGGIYMDTDVEVFKNLNRFLKNEAFVGYADDTYIGSGTFGCSPHNEFCKKLLDYYEGRHFINKDGSFYDVPNNQIYTMICIKKLGLKLGDSRIKCGKTRVYPSSYFSPFKKKIIGTPHRIYSYNNFKCSKDTYAIHYTVFSWGKNEDKSRKIKLIFNQTLRCLIPKRIYFTLKRRAKIKEMKKRVIF